MERKFGVELLPDIFGVLQAGEVWAQAAFRLGIGVPFTLTTDHAT
jgi:hypothetical protein